MTGGAGFIGRSVVPELAAAGHSIVVLDNLRRGHFGASSLESVREVCGDVRELADCIGSFQECDVVLHLAAHSNVMGSESDPDYAFGTNVTGTWNVARAATLCGVRHVIFASSREVYGNPARLPVDECEPLRPHNLYGATKVAGEAILSALRSRSLGISIVRLANVIGPGDRDRVVPNWLHAARQGEPLVMFGGTQELDLIPVDFVAAVMVRLVAGAALPEPVNVGSGTGTRLPELAEHILKTTRSSSPVDVRPAREAEVTRFRADIGRLVRIFDLQPPANPVSAIRADW